MENQTSFLMKLLLNSSEYGSQIFKSIKSKGRIQNTNFICFMMLFLFSLTLCKTKQSTSCSQKLYSDVSFLLLSNSGDPSCQLPSVYFLLNDDKLVGESNYLKTSSLAQITLPKEIWEETIIYKIYIYLFINK